MAHPHAHAGQDTSPSPPLPFLPADPNRLTAPDVERMIDSRIHLASLAREAALEENVRTARRKNLYTTVGIGVGSFAVGVGGTLIISRIVRGRKARSPAMK